AERIKGLMPFNKLLMIPLLLAQFRRSGNIRWIAHGLLASCTVLLVASYAHVLMWGRLSWGTYIPGVPAKDYITHSSLFEVCIFGLAFAAANAWEAGRRRVALLLAVLALMFLADIAYVTNSRTILVTLPVLLLLFGLIRLGRRGTLILLGAAIACTA